MLTALKLSLKLNAVNDKRPNAELSVSTHIKVAPSPQVGPTMQFSSTTAVGHQPVCVFLSWLQLAPVPCSVASGY